MLSIYPLLLQKLFLLANVKGKHALKIKHAVGGNQLDLKNYNKTWRTT